MAFHFTELPSRSQMLSETLGPALGQGLANMTTHYFANKALDKVMADKGLVDKPISERVGALEQALRPFGPVGEQLFQRRLGVEQQRAQEQEQAKASKGRRALAQKFGLSPEEVEGLTPEQITNAYKALNPQPKGGVTAQPVPKEVSQLIPKILNENKNSTADELATSFDAAGVPRIYSNSYIENRRRSEEQRAKTTESKKEINRKETFPIRQSLANKAEASRKGIANKENLLDIIKRGNVNDPTYAALAESLPLNLGKRLLSNDTTEYKAGLVEEFTDLRNIFQGQTRIKEIDLLENKIADIYLDDEQKEAVIKSRLKALKADLIRAEAASELEDREDLGVLQFEREVEKLAKPRLESLFNSILDDQKTIIENAERKKQIPLDPSDPDDMSILQQILKEARGDKKKARKIAIKKGYKF